MCPPAAFSTIFFSYLQLPSCTRNREEWTFSSWYDLSSYKCQKIRVMTSHMIPNQIVFKSLRKDIAIGIIEIKKKKLVPKIVDKKLLNWKCFKTFSTRLRPEPRPARLAHGISFFWNKYGTVKLSFMKLSLSFCDEGFGTR